MQLTFGDAEGLGQRKRTRRETFLAEMEQVVPWKALLKLIEPHYPKIGRPGRQPYPLATMLRVHFLCCLRCRNLWMARRQLLPAAG